MSAGLVALLVAAGVAGDRHPAHDVLANAADPPGGSDSSATPDRPVDLPHPHGRAVRSPASVSVPPLQAAPPGPQAIPDVALAAYERSAAVMNAADPTCHLDWTLLAAIGQVESDHGQVGGSRLDANGVDHPGILGPQLDGRHGTALIRDTDAGRLDRDTRYDRAVGPMQFLPSTWAAVAVDGDDDGRRNPQDINDAALGSAVYLCAEHDDLATRSGAQAALLRYNHSASYVAEVLAIAAQLRTTGLLSSVPTQLPVPGAATSPADHPSVRGPHHHGPPTHTSAGPPGPVLIDPVPPAPGPTSQPTTAPTTAPTTGPTTLPTRLPTIPGSPAPSTAGPTPPFPSTTSPAPSDPTSSPTGPTTPPTAPTTSPTSPTSSPSDPPPVIPDPLPQALADFTPDQVAAYDAAWPGCRAEVPDTWADSRHERRALRRCLADALGVDRTDADLHTFVHWVAIHENDPR